MSKHFGIILQLKCILYLLQKVTVDCKTNS